MVSWLENLMGVGDLTDQVIAMDMLVSAKAGIRNYAVAATEAATPEVRETFVKHLFEAIETHGRLLDYMQDRGYYQPYDMRGQIQLDQKTAGTALQIPS